MEKGTITLIMIPTSHHSDNFQRIKTKNHLSGTTPGGKINFFKKKISIHLTHHMTAWPLKKIPGKKFHD